MWEQVKDKIKALMEDDKSGHGIEHVERVFMTAMDLAEAENADKQVVGLAALLHDVDEYKIFGLEAAKNLPNARRIMRECNIDDAMQAKVCEIISTMGYSKALNGIRPQTLEGKIVSDADMLDVMGAQAILRSLTYQLAQGGSPSFDRSIFPDDEVTYDTYMTAKTASNGFVKHFFDKLLKLQSMLFTQAAKKEGKIRHEFMLSFLREWFREERAPEWNEYLERYLLRHKTAA